MPKKLGLLRWVETYLLSSGSPSPAVPYQPRFVYLESSVICHKSLASTTSLPSFVTYAICFVRVA
jgi:hypothetical protein